MGVLVPTEAAYKSKQTIAENLQMVAFVTEQGRYLPDWESSFGLLSRGWP